jgi:SNF2 family DNA or RNA helicase
MSKHSKGRSWAGDNNQIRADKIRLELLDKDNVIVDIGFNIRRQNSEYINVLKKYGGYWAENARNWRVSLENKKYLITEYEAMLKKDGLPSSALEDIPYFVDNFILPMTSPFRFKIKRLGQAQTEGYSINYNEVKESTRSIEDLRLELRIQLYEFQKEGIKFGIEKMGRVLIGDEMGVGKTIQALALCGIYYEEWPILIICPSSLRYNWCKEASNWLKCYMDEKDNIQVIWKKSEGIDRNSKIVIVSYDLAKDLVKEIEARLFHVMVCDEAHYLKSLDAQRTILLMPVLQKAKRVILLTGTPALAKPIELYPLLSIIRPDIFRDVKQYGERYCDPTFNRFSKKREFFGCDHDVELNLVLRGVMIRRLKKDVLKDLPPKIRQVRDVKGTPSVIKEIKDLMKNVEKETGINVNQIVEKMGGGSEGNEFGSGTKRMGKVEGFNLLEVSAKLYDLTAKAKLEAVVEVLTEFEEYKTKLVIFAYHKKMLERLELYARELEKKGRKYIRICGETPAQARGPLTDKFMKEPDCLLAILGITSASVGLTLTQSNIVIFAELYWTPATMFQAEDRVHRIGQNAESVYAIYLIAKDTLDQAMFDCLKSKAKTTGKILDGENAQTMNFSNITKKNDGTLNSFFGSKHADEGSKGLSKFSQGFAPFAQQQFVPMANLSFRGIGKLEAPVVQRPMQVTRVSEDELKLLDELEEIEELIRTKVKVSPENEVSVTSRTFDIERKPDSNLPEIESRVPSKLFDNKSSEEKRKLREILIDKELEDILEKKETGQVLQPVGKLNPASSTHSKDHSNDNLAKKEIDNNDQNWGFNDSNGKSNIERIDSSLKDDKKGPNSQSSSQSKPFKTTNIRF